MVQWKLLNDKAASEIWDQHLTRFDDFTLYQCYAWGEHRRSSGWIPLRLVARNNGGELVAMVQALYKPYKLGVGMLWSPGGPLGDISTWNDGLKDVILKSTSAKHLYYRFFSNRKKIKSDQDVLQLQGWQSCKQKLRSGLSMKLRLERDLEEIRKGLSRNWRRNMKQFKKYNTSISLWKNPDIREILNTYKSMESYKQLEQQFSRSELEGILERFGTKVVLYRCVDHDGQVIAFRGCVIVDRFGWDLFAATSEDGRKVRGASNALMWEIFQHCKEKGVKEYDLMGIEPDKSPGVYNFKRGTGAEFIEYLGEWEWATNNLLRWGANMAVRRLRADV